MEPIELVMDTECESKLSLALEPMQRQNIRKNIPTAEQLADPETGKGSISLAHIGRIPHRCAASGKPPIPSNKLPMVSSFVS